MSFEPLDDPLFDQVLAELEGSNPDKLRQLLKSGRLTSYLVEQVQAYQRMLEEWSQNNLPAALVQEYLAELILENESPHDQREDPEPLNEQEELLLKRWKESVGR